MSWRSKRGGDKAEQTLAAATLARITGADGSRAAAIAAVRGALARLELERPVESVVLVVLGEHPFGEELAAALGDDLQVTVSESGEVAAGEFDTALAVAGASQPAREVVEALGALDAILVGVVLVDDLDVRAASEDDAPPAPAEPPSFDAELERHVAPRPTPVEPEDTADPADAALEALAELERAAGSVTVTSGPAATEPPRPEPPAPEPEPEPEPEPAAPEPVGAQATPVDDELTRRLTELTHREAALRKITQAVEQQRSRLEERERELAQARADDPRLEEAVKRAEQAERRVEELEARVAELAERLEARASAPPPAPAEPVIAPPPVVSAEEPEPPRYDAATGDTYNLYRLEHLVRDAQSSGDPAAEEWAYYLPLLREHADADGRLPAQFYSLIDSVFGI